MSCRRAAPGIMGRLAIGMGETARAWGAARRGLTGCLCARRGRAMSRGERQWHSQSRFLFRRGGWVPINAGTRKRVNLRRRRKMGRTPNGKKNKQYNEEKFES